MVEETKNCNVVKRRITVSIEEKLVEWIDQQVDERIEWKDRSLAFELIVSEYKKKSENNEKT